MGTRRGGQSWRENSFVPGIFSTVRLGRLPGARARLWPPAPQAALPPSPVPGSAAPSRASSARPGKREAGPVGLTEGAGLPAHPASFQKKGLTQGFSCVWHVELHSSRTMG